MFEALFAGSNFKESNPVSLAMEEMLRILREYTLETEAEKRELRELYASVRMRAEGIKTDAGRQSVIKDLLHKSFFKEAFKATSEKMGLEVLFQVWYMKSDFRPITRSSAITPYGIGSFA